MSRNSYMRYSVIIATCGRSHELSQLLESLAKQTHLPEEVLVIDASYCDETSRVCSNFARTFRLKYVVGSRASLPAQKNEALSILNDVVSHVLVLDDDCICSTTFAESLLAPFLEDSSLVGTGGNIINDQGWNPSPLARAILSFLLICPAEGGRVLRSGYAFPLMLKPTDALPLRADFLLGGCLMMRLDLAKKLEFDRCFDRFGGYAFLEDVDFTLRLARHGSLLFVPSASLQHLKSASGNRPRQIKMGIMETWNRAYLVHKHFNSKLDWLCYFWASGWLVVNHMIRFYRVGMPYRVLGNVLGLCLALVCLVSNRWCTRTSSNLTES